MTFIYIYHVFRNMDEVVLQHIHRMFIRKHQDKKNGFDNYLTWELSQEHSEMWNTRGDSESSVHSPAACHRESMRSEPAQRQSPEGQDMAKKTPL